MLENMKANKGLRQRMAQAETIEELEKLAGAAINYQQASRHTRQRWANTIARREKELLD